MAEPTRRQVPRWLTAVLMFAITLTLTTLTYYFDIVAALYYYITILLVLTFWMYIDRQIPETLGFQFVPRWWLQIFFGIFLAAIVLGLVIWFEVLIGWVILIPISLGQSLWFLAGILAVYAVYQGVVATAEELISRGYIQQNLTTRVTLPIAIFVSSLMFALFHVPGIIYQMLPPILTIIMFGNLCLGGVMLGLAFARTRNLWLPIGLHFGWNFMLYHIVGVRGDGILQYQDLGPTILTGGSAGPEAGLIGTFAFVFLIAVVWIGTKESGGQLLRVFKWRPLLMFALGFLVFLVPVTLGLLVTGLLVFLIVWIIYAIFFLQVWENRILCSHCPHYGTAGKILRCHANYGLFKLWKYNPAPLSRGEQAQTVIGVIIMIGFPFLPLVWSQQWLFLIFALFGTIILGTILFGWLCLRCVNFSCPFNRVPKKIMDTFLKEHLEMHNAWKEKGYKLD